MNRDLSPRRPSPRNAKAALVLAVAGALAAVLACQRAGSGTEAAGGAPAESTQPTLASPLDLGAVMRQVHFSFRPDGSGFSGGHGTYSVAVDPARGTQIAPLHRPPGGEAVRGRPLRLRTAGIARGSEPARRPGLVRLTPESCVAIDLGGIAEEQCNAEEGLEQRWRLASRPAGTGDLEIRVHFDGQSFVGQTGGGLHFAEPSGLGIRYGAATWVDADRKTSPIAAIVDGDQIVLRVPARTLESSRFPAVLDPLISPEIAMDVPVTAPAYWATKPAVAFDGTNFLAVWSDQRGNAAGINGSGIFATRVGAAGAVLDPAGIPLTPTDIHHNRPAIAFDGANYVVIWEEDAAWATTKIHGTRVSPAGTVLSATGFDLSASLAPSGGPSVACDGTNCLAVWGDYSRSWGGKLMGARISKSGTVLDATPKLLADVSGTTSQAVQNTAIGFDGTNYLVAWEDSRASVGVYATRVTPAGAALDTGGFSVATGVVKPAIGFDGANYLVVFAQNSTAAAVLGARVAPSGTVLGSLTVSPASTSNARSPAVAFDGTEFMVIWSDVLGPNTADLMGARVSSAGTVLDPAGLALASGTSYRTDPAIAAGGGAYFLAFTNAAGAWDVMGSRLTKAGVVQDQPPLLLSKALNQEERPAVGSNGTDFLVTWVDNRTGFSAVVGVRVRADGTVLDSPAIAIADNVGYQRPAVAWDGTNYLVIFGGRQSAIVGRRVSSAGAVVDSADLPIAAAGSTPAVAFDGTNYLVVWNDVAGGAWDIRGTRVTPAGQVLDAAPGLAICVDPASQFLPAVASNGSGFLAVWRDHRLKEDIFGARVATDGTVLDPSGFQLNYDPNALANNPAVASDGTGYLAAWETSHSIKAVRVDGNGTRRDTADVALDTTTTYVLPEYPVAAFNGVNYSLAWSRQTMNTSYNVTSRELRFARIGPAGPALDMPIFVASGRVGDSNWAPAIGGGRNGRGLIAYTKTDSSAGYALDRVKAVVVSEPQIGGPCTSAASCPSGFCVDQVCCESACGGGSATDCLACSVAAGSSADGICRPVPNGQACGAGGTCSAGSCQLPDAGSAVDAGRTDAGAAVDAGAAKDAGADAGAAVDAGAAKDAGADAGAAVDAGAPRDGGRLDGGGTADSGSSMDGGRRDGSIPDAAGQKGDTGTGVDLPDAEAPASDDAGVDGQPAAPVGCGCGSSGQASPGLLVVGWVLLGGLRRSRRRR